MADEQEQTHPHEQPEAAPAMPETFSINGVSYVRQDGAEDQLVNRIQFFQRIADRTGLSLRQVIWFATSQPGDSVMPDA